MIKKFKDEFEFLSNFHKAKFMLYGYEWKTAEHAYQASKTNDSRIAHRIRSMFSPSAAKRMGKTIELRPEWEHIKLNVMYNCVHAKFNQNEHLKEKLLNTLTHELVEGNHWGDTFWGVCDNVGENHLGKILMRVRQELHVAGDESIQISVHEAAERFGVLTHMDGSCRIFLNFEVEDGEWRPVFDQITIGCIGYEFHGKN